MVDSSEKRDFRRMQIDCEILWRLEDGDSMYHAQAINLSARGLAMTCDQDLPVGTRLEVNINPAYRVVPPMNAIVEILRVSKLDDNKYQYACEIREFLD